jgi:amino acid permease
MKQITCILLILLTAIGAGILALPYHFSKIGIIPSIIIWIIVSIAMYINSLILIKTELLFKGIKGLPGIFEIYFGKRAKIIILIILTLSIYFAIFAYLKAISESISKYFSFHPFLIILLIINSFIVYLSKYSIESFGLYYSIFKFLFLIAAIIFFLLNYKTEKKISLINADFNSLISFFGISMFAFMFYTIIPNLKTITRDEKILKNSVKYSLFIIFILYFIFCIVFYNDIEIATLKINEIFDFLTIVFVFSPYVLLSYALNETLKNDFNLSNKQSFIFSVALPFILYLILPLSFSKFIEISGGIFGCLMFLLISYYGLKNEKLNINKKLLIFLFIFSIIGFILSVINI